MKPVTNDAVDRFVRQHDLSVNSFVVNMARTWNAVTQSISPRASHVIVGRPGRSSMLMLGDDSSNNSMMSNSSRNSFEQLIMISYTVSMLPYMKANGLYFVEPDLHVSYVDDMGFGGGGVPGLASVQPDGGVRQYGRPVRSPDAVYTQTEKYFLEYQEGFCLPSLPEEYYSDASRSQSPRERLVSTLWWERPFFEERWEADTTAEMAKFRPATPS